MTAEANGAESPHLRRELRLWEAVGISLALMAPSMAANINPQGTAGTRRTRRSARVRAGDDRCAPDRLDLRPADPALRPRRQRVRLRRGDARPAGRRHLGVGADGHVHLLRRRHVYRGRHLRRGVP